jgi:hypothetical protein
VTLATFLRARLDEDERYASHGGPVNSWASRVLAEVKAKREIVADFEAYTAAPDRLTNPGTLLYWMALRTVMYAFVGVCRDHPDYAAAIEAMRNTR